LPAQVVTSNGDIYEVACSALLVHLQLQPAALLHRKSKPLSLAELLMASQGLYVQLAISASSSYTFPGTSCNFSWGCIFCSTGANSMKSQQ
jgi:hypothetical protein